MNREIRQLEEDLVAVLNASDLPAEVKRLVVGNIYCLVEKKADEAIVEENRPITEYGESYAESVE